MIGERTAVPQGRIGHGREPGGALVLRRLWSPGPVLLLCYLGAVCAVQLEASAGGLRWAPYSAFAPLAAATVLPVRRTFAIGVATLAASVAIYGFVIGGVSVGGRTVVIMAAALSFAASVVLCRARLRLQQRQCPAPGTCVPAPVTAAAVPSPAGSDRSHPQRCDSAPSAPDGLLVTSLPGSGAVEAVGRYVPACDHTGSSAHWLDAIPLPGARVALVAGSVSEDSGTAASADSGTAASAAATGLRAAVRTLADIDLQPDELLTHLDDVLGRLRPEGRQVSAACLYAVYDPVSGRCSLSTAGHPAPLAVTPDGTVVDLELPPSRPLGMARPSAEATEVEFPTGSVLLVRTGSPVGEPADETVLGALARTGEHGRSLDDVCRAVLRALPRADRPCAAVLAARTRTFGSDAVATWDLAHDPAAVSHARAHVAAKLADWGLADATQSTQLIASELVTNAIRHAVPPFRLRLIRHDAMLTCEVSDSSSTTPHLRRARTFDESGRGLFIVAQLTQRWGCRHSGTGKTIWGEQPC
ncbi:SpoIIE family protein phosphatase [Actinacidiphila sp. bgisy167]|uniref:SpoIIE family protein phosphatase n=1 Tax=Actinacidiphila sp. bgisy167 TaxID=3413797 RepID=UPI003D73E594